MPLRAAQDEEALFCEALRYGNNGVAATGVHYAVLLLNLHVFGFRSPRPNLCAAAVGISAPFLGSRYLFFLSSTPVFSSRRQNTVFRMRVSPVCMLQSFTYGLTLAISTITADF
jgi:putative flippase GtrA